MSVEDDLATLQRLVWETCGPEPVGEDYHEECREIRAALKSVEAEIASLKEERDGSVFLRSLADASADTWRNRAETAETEVERLREANAYWVDKKNAEIERLRAGLRAIADRVYPAVYIGEAKDGTKMYGGSDDASRFARSLLAEDEGDGREPDDYRIEGGRVIPTDR